MLPNMAEPLLVARATTSPTPLPSSSAPSYGSGSNSSSSNEFVYLIASPFDNTLSTKSIISSVIFSLAFSLLLTIAFSLIRPYHNVVYAPRAKYADSKHAPPPVRQGLFGWARTIMGVREPELVEKLGLDAALFMRFIRMMRNIFSILTVVGCGLFIPTNLLSSSSTDSFLFRLTPEYIFGDIFWVYVVGAYVFDIVICYFLWRNYRAILQLRRQYFENDEYQRALHSRTLLLTDVPRESRTDEGIVRIVEQVQSVGDVPRAAVARNVKDLPELIEEHEKSVRELEKVLAKYLKNPNHLPAKRPTCKASTSDRSYSKGQTVDAIEYLTGRIKELEVEIRQVRESVDTRNAMSYGFASYASITDAHTVAYAARKNRPQGTIIRQAPKPNDLIWKNLSTTKKERDWQNFINNLWVTLLTLVYVVPNVLIAVFLTNLSHLGLVWPAFENSLFAHPTLWSLVQGILAPAITTAVFIFLPKLFRLLVTRAGDVTRTSRERHVMSKLFTFFMFNNLVVFSLFSSVWGFIAVVIKASKADDQSVYNAIKQDEPFSKLVFTLITITPYWMVWLLQRNLSSAVDLSQLVTLVWRSVQRRFMSPTPRELIELSAPQPIEYASYYNYFLFYTVVTLCFGPLQPLIFPVTALYFWMDSFSKKYLLLYIFITKYESGGMFWRPLFNRLLICTFMGNLIVALVVIVKGSSWAMIGVMAALPFLLIGFKVYCARTFDDAIYFYNRGPSGHDMERMGNESKRRKGDKVGVRFGNPMLYKPLMTPMVAAKSQHLLKQVYSGRTSFDESRNVAGYSDVYMNAMDRNQPGKSSDGAGANAASAPFEFVGENQLDYEHWKNDANFASAGGGDGELFGQASDVPRPGTPGSMMTSNLARTTTWESHYSGDGASRPGSRSRSGSPSPYKPLDNEGVEYPKGYHVTPSGLREHSPARSDYSAYQRPEHMESRENLVSGAARMGRSAAPPMPNLPGGLPTSGFGSGGRSGSGSRPGSAYGQFLPQHARGIGSTSSAGSGGHQYGGPPGGYGMIRMTPGEDLLSTPGEEDTSYDYFRRGRPR